MLYTSSGDGGPDPLDLLEKRVGALEADVKDIKVSLAKMEMSFARIEEKLSFVALRDDLARIEGRVAQIPTIWQIVGILAALMFGVAPLVYATTNFITQKQTVAASTSKSAP
jgi:hypothetical protein